MPKVSSLQFLLYLSLGDVNAVIGSGQGEKINRCALTFHFFRLMNYTTTVVEVSDIYFGLNWLYKAPIPQ